MLALLGYDWGTVIHPEPNTNLIWPRTVLPMLQAELVPGEHILICAVWTDAGDCLPREVPAEVRELAERL